MIDAQITQATCRVTCDKEVGTGMLVASNRVITARHCVAGAIASGNQVDLQFDLNGLTIDVIATVLAEDESIDICVLQLARNLDVAPIVLDDSPPLEGSRFSAFGFPVAKLSLGHRMEGSISRVLNRPKLIMNLDLQVDPSAALTDYKGCWRSPKIDHLCSLKIDQGRKPSAVALGVF